MLISLSLRLRIFLLFLGVAAACAGVVVVSLYAGYLKSPVPGDSSGFVLSGILSVFGILAVATGVWLLFDENVAKPIERLSAAIRVRSQTDEALMLDLNEARYLGDLGPAVDAVTGKLKRVSQEAETMVEAETARLMAEKAHLAILLTEIPVAIILVSPGNQIMLYDGQAADILGQVHVPRLSASIFEYFNEDDLKAALSKFSETLTEVTGKVRCTRNKLTFELRLKRLSKASGYMILIDAAKACIAPDAARPLIYDFDLSEQRGEQAIEDTPIDELTFVVFDTETTGLTPHKDELVQIGAVRVRKGHVVEGETLDILVNPGRPIPPSSTKVHGITDEMVAGAPDATAAVETLHDFAQGAVLVAHNAPFDMAFVERHSRSLGLDWDNPKLDTVLLSAVLFGETEKHDLDSVCARLGVAVSADVRHTGLGDATVTAEALCTMLPILVSRGYRTFADLVAQTRRHGRLLKDLN
ncbi:3'-5' exonuclease [Rhodobacterales bacterium]|nr:3'-5' exonuclease [Rhodobacterales bacterium]